MHLDLSNKVTAVQELLTRIRNRSTEVETLTSGPGVVITVKDLSECMIEFSKHSLCEFQKQAKSRQESFCIKEQYLLDLLYQKDRTIANMRQRLLNIQANLDSAIDARLFEKGN